MKRVIVILGGLALMLPGLAGAAEIFEKVGTFDGQFLKISVGARAAGMGNAFVAVADDAIVRGHGRDVAQVHGVQDRHPVRRPPLRLQRLDVQAQQDAPGVLLGRLLG